MDVTALKKLLGRPVAFHRCLVDAGGGVLEGLMLSQAIYWSQRTDDAEGWFFKTKDEWEAETGLSRKQQDTARRKLRDRKLWQEQRGGKKHGPLHFRVDFERLAEVLSQYAQQIPIRSLSDPVIVPIGHCPKGAVNKARLGLSLTCTETTTESTNDEATQEGWELPGGAYAVEQPDGTTRIIRPDPASVKPAPPPPRKPSTSPHHRLIAAYQDALGYRITDGAPTGKAAKAILSAGYTEEQVVACYHWLKRQEFWRDKHLPLASVLKQLGPWKQAQASTAPEPTYYSALEELTPEEEMARADRDRAFAQEVNRRQMEYLVRSGAVQH